MKSSRLLIEYQCPQCGAPATLEETDHLVTCGFCRVTSYLLSRVYRYVLPHKAGEGREILYVPYWRFKGMRFICTEKGVSHRIVDVSLRGVESPHIPVSLGLRSQTQKLRFLTPSAPGRFLRSDITYSDMLERIQGRFGRGGASSLFLQEFIGETLSIIYAPFYSVNGRLYDAVLDRPSPRSGSDEADLEGRPGGRPAWELQFVPAQCPECGWDLEGERDSFALCCRNCQSVWHAGKKRFTRLPFATLRDAAPSSSTLHLPFYRIRPRVTGLPLNSRADLVRLANLPKAVREPMESEPFHFWAPAFKVRPEDFMRMSLRVTLGQPTADGEPRLPAAGLYPVTLPVTEAVESLKLNLASFMKPRGTLYPRLPDITVEPTEIVLMYVPFQVNANEVLYPPCHLRIHRKILAYGRQL